MNVSVVPTFCFKIGISLQKMAQISKSARIKSENMKIEE